MTTFWSLWIIIITVGTLLGCAAILYWCLKDKMGAEDSADMGHEYDGIRELNNPLPKWWTYLFVFMFVVAIVYFTLFPGLGKFAGLLGWQSSEQGVLSIEQSNASISQAQSEKQLDQYAKELEQANETFAKELKKYTDASDGQLLTLPEIATNPKALKVGQRIYLQNCAQCHGSDARGQKGYPNLTDNDWLYGGTPDDIIHSLLYGRHGQMAAWKDVFDDEGIEELTSYVLSLSGRKVNLRQAQAGKTKFAVCAACHGVDGKGNTALGAPNLTDNIWLYGGTRQDIRDTLLYGRNAVMPAWKDFLGADKVQLVAAYVWSLSHPIELKEKSRELGSATENQ